VLLSTPLHASSNFTVSVQLANKRGFTKQKKNIKKMLPVRESSSEHFTNAFSANVLTQLTFKF
jgi:hypothetical protein